MSDTPIYDELAIKYGWKKPPTIFTALWRMLGFRTQDTIERENS